MQLDLLVAQKDWPAAIKRVGEIDGPSRQITLMVLCYKICSQSAEVYPPEFRQAAAKAFGVMLDNPNGRSTPMDHVVRASLAQRTGDKDQALASAKKAATLAAAQPQGKGALQPAPFERFAAAVEAGTPPNTADLAGG
ncbi:MAG: hypothetical protein WCK77_00080 [Verrucomicrobiota bacterium]